MEKQQKHTTRPSPAATDERPEQPKSSGKRGATEQQVTPLTPPMARSDELPNEPKRKQDTPAEREIDPADELTPG